MKSAYISLITGPRGLVCEANLWKIMFSESSDVVRFDLGPLLQVFITLLLLILQVCNVKPSYGKSWARNTLTWSNLTYGPSFKVK